MEKHHKFSVWYVLLGIWIVLIVHNILFTAMSLKTIPYSEFLNLLKQNKVSEVAITSNQIQGKIKTGDDAGELFRTVRVDPDISRLLDDYQVEYKGEIESTFFRDLLSWIVPILVFVGIWFYLIKRIQGQQPGFMTLGKNKAKIYMQDEIGVTFDDA